jgi:hypothetical protein
MHCHQPLVTILEVVLLPTSLLLATAARPPLSVGVIDVPRGPSVVIDGRIDVPPSLRFDPAAWVTLTRAP